MAKLDIKEGVIKFQEKLYKSMAVFEKDSFYSKAELDLFNETKQRNLYVPNENDVNKSANPAEEYKSYQKFIKNDIKKLKNIKIHKARYYLKVVKPECDINETNKILTFVLFNPSYANQYKLDGTIANCAYLTFKNKNYNGFEILNLVNKRNPKADSILKNWKKDCDICKYKNVVFKEVVLAWGEGKNKEDIVKCKWFRINEKFKKPNTKYYTLCADIAIKGALHFGNMFWNAQKLPFKKSLDSGEIQFKPFEGNI